MRVADSHGRVAWLRRIMASDCFSSDPKQMRINLIVIRVSDIDRSAAFYRALGLVLVKERHGTGPEHYSADLKGRS
jgi:catechol-2,3-dioxygenase